MFSNIFPPCTQIYFGRLLKCETINSTQNKLHVTDNKKQLLDEAE